MTKCLQNRRDLEHRIADTLSPEDACLLPELSLKMDLMIRI